MYEMILTFSKFSILQAHYSAMKMANWMGIGQNNVVKIKTSKSGAMISSELQKAIKDCKDKGKTPLAVIGTIGTTVLGAFDNLEELSEANYFINIAIIFI